VKTWHRILIMTAGALLLAFAAFARDPETPKPAPQPPPPPEHDMMIFRAGGSRLGVEIEDIDAGRARALKLREETGVEIRSVAPEGPGAKAGLKDGDVILEYQGTRVESARQLVRMVRETPPGRTVTLKVWRDGGERAVKATVEERDREKVVRDFRRHRIVVPPIEVPDIDIPLIPELGHMPTSLRLGASVETLTDQLAEYFGVKDGAGVLVRSVRKGSPGETAGLRAGDVIVRVDDRQVGDSADLRAALRGRRGEDVTLTVVRDRREQKLSVRMPKPEDTPAGRQFRWQDREEVREAMERAREELERAHREIESLDLEGMIDPIIESLTCDDGEDCEFRFEFEGPADAPTPAPGDAEEEMELDEEEGGRRIESVAIPAPRAPRAPRPPRPASIPARVEFM
jgi:membrane-associated protease RseP (regulator of RpoE activity)